MTFSHKVWSDVLCRLQKEIPDFAFDAWIAPLALKIAPDRIALGCPTSFHRDRVRIQYAEMIETHLAHIWHEATHAEPLPASESKVPRLELLMMSELAGVPGRPVEVEMPIRNIEADCEGAESFAKPIAAGQTTTGGPASPEHPGSESHSSTRTETAMQAARAVRIAETQPVSGSGAHLSAVPRATPNKRVSPSAGAGPVGKRNKSASATATPSSLVTGPVAGSRAHAASARPAPPKSRASTDPDQAELPFSFESFIVGPCNALAREAVLALARARQRSLNQVYLGAAAGMGKTHLARAAAHEARRHAMTTGANLPSARRSDFTRPAPTPSGTSVVFTSAERFTSDFVSAMRGGRSEEFKRRYRGSIELLVVEDVQFFSGRTKTQLELFNTVQHVLDAGGRVLLTGDRAPRELAGLDERLRSQVARGFVAEMEAPDALVRRHILRSKAAAGGFRLPDECLDLLVGSTEGSVRDIESVLIQVVTTASLLGRRIDLELTREAIDLKTKSDSPRAPRTIPVSEIVRIVAAFFGKRPEALASRSRRRDVLIPRQLAMYLAHRYTDASLAEIGRTLGRDHPSVRNAIERIERQVLENAPVRYQVEALSERLDQRLQAMDEKA